MNNSEVTANIFEYFLFRLLELGWDYFLLNIITFFCIIDRIIVQVACDTDLSLAKHLAFPDPSSGMACPVCERSQALPQFLATRSAFDLEVPLLGLATIVRETKKGELLGLLAPLVRRFPSKTTELDASGLLHCQRQPKFTQPVGQLLEERLGIASVLKTRQKVIGKAKVVRFALTLLLDFAAKPQVQHIVQVNIRQQRRQD